jgi:Phosphatase
VYFATGHPASLAQLYQGFADALRSHGCTILHAGEGWGYDASTRYGTRRLTIGYSAAYGDLGPSSLTADGDVAALEEAGGPVHSHAARPIKATLSALAAAGRPLPDLVVADHGWCGGAAQAGVDAIGFADCNDPALFVGEYEGVVRVAVPLDDGLDPAVYEPLGRYVLGRLDETLRTVTES